MCLDLLWEERPLSLPLSPASLTRLNSVGKQLTFATAGRERERRKGDSESVGSAANNCIQLHRSYTVMQASSHVFSQQEAELSLHFAFGNEFISVVNTVECFFISSLAHSLFVYYIRFGHSQLLSLKFS